MIVQGLCAQGKQPSVWTGDQVSPPDVLPTSQDLASSSCYNLVMRRRFYALMLGAVSLSVLSETSAAGETIQLPPVQVGGTSQPADPSEAVPTSVPLTAIQPTSVINRQFIRNAVPATGDYGTITALAPSVLAVSPNGPGLGDAAALTIRGFSDGQYNVTFDGIPFADSDDFTHHSADYFAAHILDSAIIDRGPGTASTIGSATFGGTLSLLSRDPAQTRSGEVYGSVGSFNTHLFGAEANTGAIQSLDGGAYMLDVERSTSDGYLTNTPQKRTSFFFKGKQPVGDNTTLTVMIDTQWTNGGRPFGATKAQIAAFGPNYNLSNNPLSQNYAGYNQQNYRTDFEYLRVQSQLNDTLALDNKVYTYALYRRLNSGADVNGEQPNGTAFGPENIPGTVADNGLRAYGDVLTVTKDVSAGTLRAGVWAEHQVNNRGQQDVDETLGRILNPVLPPVAGIPGSAGVVRQQRDLLDTFQPFGELEWRATSALTVTIGLKYAVAIRSENAPVNQGTRMPLRTDATWGAPLPALTLHYDFAPSWAAYAQVARGFLAPPLQFFDVIDPKSDTVSPESTTNYQIGTTLRKQRFALAVDGYYIDFQNFVGSRTVGGEPLLFNEGGVSYLGLEGEGTLVLGSGFSLYTNASVNSARQKSDGAPVPNTPQATMAGGLIYDRDAWYGSLIDKWVGGRYGDTERQQWLQPFNQLDLSVGWRWSGQADGSPALKLQLLVQNLLNSTKINDLAGYTLTDKTPLYFTQTGRSVFFNASAQF
jgi:iron complex outermembrane recepter protein